MNKQKILNNLRGYQFLIIALVFYAVFIVYPVVIMVRNSFFDINTMGQANLVFAGLENYKNLIKDSTFLRSVLNTVGYTAGILILINVPAILFALILDRGKIRGNYFLRVMFFMPVIISPVLIAATFKRIFAPFGFINLVLKNLGISSVMINWLGIPTLALFAVMLTTAWAAVGWDMVLYYARLKEIPQELYDAASIDGASDMGIIRHIKLPLMRDIIGIVIILNTIGGLKVFDYVFIMTYGGPAHRTEVLTTYLYFQAFNFYKWGYASAIAVILLVLILIFTYFRIANSLKT
jgi:raffinose/stachyose/melibiose transport system permease protein